MEIFRKSKPKTDEIRGQKKMFRTYEHKIVHIVTSDNQHMHGVMTKKKQFVI